MIGMPTLRVELGNDVILSGSTDIAPGVVLNGSVYLHTHGKIHTKSFYVCLEGVQIKWVYKDGNNKREKVHLINKRFDISQFGNCSIEPGRHKYDFFFTLPGNLAETINTRYFSTEYSVKVVLKKNGVYQNFAATKSFIIKRDLYSEGDIPHFPVDLTRSWRQSLNIKVSLNSNVATDEDVVIAGVVLEPMEKNIVIRASQVQFIESLKVFGATNGNSVTSEYTVASDNIRFHSNESFLPQLRSNTRDKKHILGSVTEFDSNTDDPEKYITVCRRPSYIKKISNSFYTEKGLHLTGYESIELSMKLPNGYKGLNYNVMNNDIDINHRVKFSLEVLKDEKITTMFFAFPIYVVPREALSLEKDLLPPYSEPIMAYEA